MRVGKRAREPRLHQRAGVESRKYGRPIVAVSSPRMRQRRLLAAGRLPGSPRRRSAARQARGEQARCAARPGARASSHRVVQCGVRVAGEQHDLEEHQADGPHRARAAEPGQDLLGDERLHQEQQHGAREDRRGVQGPDERSRHIALIESAIMGDSASQNQIVAQPNPVRERRRTAIGPPTNGKSCRKAPLVSGIRESGDKSRNTREDGIDERTISRVAARPGRRRRPSR